ncbi:MAG TPA: 16S rRNA (guanine(527)-N(7))-methyltransferase RsmG [Dehalococcoidia bacterium]|nr:16S rRNA (guanine(527)-N(7))-methyltransferase RsmG [Dehalococcoidia bacterium]
MEKLAAGAGKLGLSLTGQQLAQFEIYYQELVAYNQRMNLTAITEYEEVQLKHFLDSLSVVLALEPPLGEGFSLIDVGSGAGLPGIPLKIALPELKLVLLEATAKKAAFLRHVKDKLGLDEVEVVCGRAEDIAHEAGYREQFTLVVSRAVARLATLVELALPFCAPGGRFIAQKKGDITREVADAARAIELVGGELREIKGVDLEELADARWLVIIDKVAPTPQQYPRRPGIPAKRPLGRSI